MIDLLVVSHSCFTPINRNIYILLQKEGVRVEIVTSESLTYPTGVVKAKPARQEDPPIHFLKLKGTNPRIYTYEDIDKVLEERRPRYILLDADPVSILARQLGSWAVKNNAHLLCISCENLSLDVIATVKRRGIRSIFSAIAKQFLLKTNKRNIYSVLCLNEDGVKIFRQEGYKNVVLMPLGFDPAYFQPNSAAGEQLRSKLEINKPVIAYFGRLVYEKGLHILIEALGRIKHLDWQFMIDEFDIYASAYSQRVSELMLEHGIEERTIHINPDHFEIANYMNAADIVVVPSVTVKNWKEQYGRVAAEAMACGCIVIASNSGSLPDLVGDAGIIFPESDVAALAATLENTLGNLRDLQQSKASVATHALEKLSINSQRDVLLRIMNMSAKPNSND